MKRNEKLNFNKIFNLLQNNYLLTLLFGFIYFFLLHFYSLPIKNDILKQSTLSIKLSESNDNTKRPGILRIFDDKSFDTSCHKLNFRNINFFDAIKICLTNHLKNEFLEKGITLQLKNINEFDLYSNDKLNKDIIGKQIELAFKEVFNKKKIIEHINFITQKRLDYKNDLIGMLNNDTNITQQESILDGFINNDLNFNFTYKDFFLISDEFNITYEKLLIIKATLLKQKINNKEFFFNVDELSKKSINNDIIYFILLTFISILLSFLTIIILSFKLPKFIK